MLQQRCERDFNFVLGFGSLIYRRVIITPPPNRPQQPERAGQKENPAPRRAAKPVAIHQHERDERWRHDRTEGCSRIDDAHGRRAIIDRKPFRHRAGGCRKAAAFAHAEEQAAGCERKYAACQAVARTRKRPENHDAQKTAPRSQFIEQQSTADIHQSVGHQKRRIQTRLDLVAEGDIHLYRFDRPRQCLPIQITDGNRRTDQESNGPPRFRSGFG